MLCAHVMIDSDIEGYQLVEVYLLKELLSIRANCLQLFTKNGAHAVDEGSDYAGFESCFHLQVLRHRCLDLRSYILFALALLSIVFVIKSLSELLESIDDFANLFIAHLDALIFKIFCNARCVEMLIRNRPTHFANLNQVISNYQLTKYSKVIGVRLFR
jgi:hypothetical protein